MKPILSRAVAVGAVAATVVPAFLALAPAAHAVTGYPSQNDAQVVGAITLYNSQGQVVTSGKLSDRPIAAYAVGDKVPRSGDTKAALFVAQPDPAQPSGNWNADQLSSYTTFPASSAPAPVNGFDASHPVVTGGGTDQSLASFIAQFSSPPAGSNDNTYANLYQLRLKTANGGGQQTDTYDAMDVKVDTAAGTWTEVYPTNSADTTAPTVTAFKTPTALTGSGADSFVTFSETVTGADAANLKLIVTGGSAIATSIACFSTSTPVACSATFDTVRLRPITPLLAGQRYTIVAAAGATHDVAGNASAAASTNFRGLTTLEENNSVITRTWQTVGAKPAFGGSFQRARLVGALSTWSFTGTSVTVYMVSGKDQGLADIYIDGIKKTTVNSYAKSTKFKVAHTISRLRSGPHTVGVFVRGKKGNKAATNTFVSVDRFVSGKQHSESPSSTTWSTVVNRNLYGGHGMQADLAGQTFTLSFRGTGITWYSVRGLTQGQAVVYLDGKKKTTIDDFAKKTVYKVKHAFTKLADKSHTLRVVVLGKHHAGGTGTLITLDRLSIS